MIPKLLITEIENAGRHAGTVEKMSSILGALTLLSNFQKSKERFLLNDWSGRDLTWPYRVEVISTWMFLESNGKDEHAQS